MRLLLALVPALFFAVPAAGVTAACPATLAAQVEGLGRAAQLVTVEAPGYRSTSASLRLWQRDRGCWRPAGGPWTARVGWRGIAHERREGDGTTPAGIFTIGRVMYGNAPDPGVRYRYRRLTCGDWWDEDPRSPTYNTFQHVRCGTRPPFRTTTPGLWQEKTAYAHFAVIEFNTRPVVPGRGSGIFLHAKTGSSTNGCISLPRSQLVRTLRWLDPAKRPRIAVGTPSSLRG